MLPQPQKEPLWVNTVKCIVGPNSYSSIQQLCILPLPGFSHRDFICLPHWCLAWPCNSLWPIGWQQSWPRRGLRCAWESSHPLCSSHSLLEDCALESCCVRRIKFWGADLNPTHFLESSLAQPKLGEAQPIHRFMRKKTECFLFATELGLFCYAALL